MSVLALLAAASLLAPIPTAGQFSRYAPGKMRAMIERRQRRPDLPSLSLEHLARPDLDGFIAVEECWRFDTLVEARPEGQAEWELFLIADCSGHAETTAWMRAENIIGEIDYQTAERWGFLPANPRGEIRPFVPHLERYWIPRIAEVR